MKFRRGERNRHLIRVLVRHFGKGTILRLLCILWRKEERIERRSGRFGLRGDGEADTDVETVIGRIMGAEHIGRSTCDWAVVLGRRIFGSSNPSRSE